MTAILWYVAPGLLFVLAAHGAVPIQVEVQLLSCAIETRHWGTSRVKRRMSLQPGLCAANAGSSGCEPPPCGDFGSKSPRLAPARAHSRTGVHPAHGMSHQKPVFKWSQSRSHVKNFLRRNLAQLWQGECPLLSGSPTLVLRTWLKCARRPAPERAQPARVGGCWRRPSSLRNCSAR